jgi:hypothetical protein
MVGSWPDAEVPRCLLSRRCQGHSGHKRAFRNGVGQMLAQAKKDAPPLSFALVIIGSAS